MGSSPSWAAFIRAAIKLMGVQFASSGVLLMADRAMRVNRSGVSTVGRALRISGSSAFTMSTMVMFLVSLTGWFRPAAARCSNACFTSAIIFFSFQTQEKDGRFFRTVLSSFR